MEIIPGRPLPGDDREEVTFGNFKQVMDARGHTIADLVNEFRGKIENPREFFERVMSPKVEHREVVIPFASVLAFYAEESHYVTDSDPSRRRCDCGCKAPVFGRRRYASDACKKRASRKGHGQ